MGVRSAAHWAGCWVCLLVQAWQVLWLMRSSMCQNETLPFLAVQNAENCSLRCVRQKTSNTTRLLSDATRRGKFTFVRRLRWRTSSRVNTFTMAVASDHWICRREKATANLTVDLTLAMDRGHSGKTVTGCGLVVEALRRFVLSEELFNVYVRSIGGW